MKTNHEEYEFDESSTASFLTGILIGAAVGATAALLLAPKSGKETIDQLKGIADQQKDNLKDQWERTKDKAKTAADTAKEKLTTIADQASSKIDSLTGKAGTASGDAAFPEDVVSNTYGSGTSPV